MASGPKPLRSSAGCSAKCRASAVMPPISCLRYFRGRNNNHDVLQRSIGRHHGARPKALLVLLRSCAGRSSDVGYAAPLVTWVPGSDKERKQISFFWPWHFRPRCAWLQCCLATNDAVIQGFDCPETEAFSYKRGAQSVNRF